MSIDLIAQSLKFGESIKKIKFTVKVEKSQKLVIYVTVTSSSKVNSQDIEDPIIPQMCIAEHRRKRGFFVNHS